jgi:hypothetical protein
MVRAVLGAVLVACLVLGVADAGAPPPPGPPEQGQILVKRPCVPFGHKIGFEGVGYAPGTPVKVEAYVGHYQGPGFIRPTTVTSNEDGEIVGFLEDFAGSVSKWGWIQEVIIASGLNRGGQHRGTSFGLEVIGSPRVCRVLNRH